MNKDEREAFEKEYKKRGAYAAYDLGNNDGTYYNPFTQAMWEGWKARSTIDAELVELLRNQAGKNYVITIENRDNVNEVFVHYGEGRLDYVFRDYYGSETYVEGMTHSEAYMAALSAAIKAALAKHKGKD